MSNDSGVAASETVDQSSNEAQDGTGREEAGVAEEVAELFGRETWEYTGHTVEPYIYFVNYQSAQVNTQIHIPSALLKALFVLITQKNVASKYAYVIKVFVVHLLYWRH